ncbi:amidohydrolase family protein [Rubrivirga marina]|uniref:Amidohydrolase-related domain-containing protein n=1 Tax=Rubrivirga marina TaxID=1196024 RepID=A0A271IVX5_9BACT|nr:amidohydrolase family protein [Rubrivirga marina]PAP75352.1 hypothetical protein BSZ37_02265 [Rubrivirga marina]
MRVFDAHLHVVDPRFPLVANDGFVPEPFTVEDYCRRVAGLGVTGGAVVSGSFQAFDTAYLDAALPTLGPSFVGVVHLPPDVADAEVLRLDALGVRAVRFALRRGAALDVALARRVWDLAGWHAELYVDARDLPDLPLADLPRVVIDHLGLSVDGFPQLVHAVDNGAFVKATGFGRLAFDPADALRTLVAANPEAVVFGTDLPSTRAPRPFRDADLQIVRDTLDAGDADAVLYRNAAALYRPGN